MSFSGDFSELDFPVDSIVVVVLRLKEEKKQQNKWKIKLDSPISEAIFEETKRKPINYIAKT